MAQPNKGLTFRAHCREYRKQGHIGNKLFKKVAKALSNAQIRHGELPLSYSDKNKQLIIK